MTSSRSLPIVIQYMIFGGLWIMVSDRIIDIFWSSGLSQGVLQTVKGLIFITVTGLILYILLERNFRKILIAERGMLHNKARYRTAFDNSPGPLWEEDFSEVKSLLDELRRTGVNDIGAYLDSHPDFVFDCMKRVKIIDVNQAALDLHEAEGKSELTQSLSAIFSDASFPGIKENLLAIFEGKNEFQVQTSGQTLNGRPIEYIARWSVLPGHEEKLDRVYVSATDVTELNRVKNELSESEQKYKTLIENASEGVLVIQNEKVVFANPAAEAMYGTSHHSLEGKTLVSLIHRDDRETVMDWHRRRLKGENPRSKYELRMLCGQGMTCWVELSAARIQWQSKQAVLLVISDITELKTKQEELQQTKNLLEKVFNSLKEAVLLIDPDERKIVGCNPAVKTVFGYEPEELKGHSTEILHLDRTSFDVFAKASDPQLARKKPFHTKYRMRRKDGEEIITENTVTAIDDLLGWRKGVVSVIRNITEKENAEKALRESEEKYRSLLENANESVVVIQGKRIVFANPQAEKITGYSFDNLLGFPFRQFIHKADVASIDLLMSRLQKGHEIPRDVEFRIITRDGANRWLRSNSVALEWDGQPAIMALISDISDQKRLESEYGQMEARIRHAQKMESIGTLAGGIAHDFNNLLSVILGYSRLAMDGLPKENPVSANLKTVVEAGERASELVNQILTFSRKQDEKDPQPVQLQLVVKEALKMLRSSIPSHVDIQQDIQSNSYVRIDVGRIHQVVMNLCTNAYQALTDIKGRIEVELIDHLMLPAEAEMFPELEPGDFIRLTVSDNGPGMTPDVVERIFEPYFTTKETGRGTGLGLSVTHGIVRQAGGTIAVHSKSGHGTCFQVFLPVWRGKLQIKEPRKTETARGSEHLIVVDDEKSILRLLRINLESLGYRVTIHTRAQEALEEIRKNPFDFDMVITDLAMPEMTGKELVQALIEVRPDLPVIACSGLEAGFDIEKPEKGGLRGVINKPFDKQTLSATVRNVLDEMLGQEAGKR